MAIGGTYRFQWRTQDFFSGGINLTKLTYI